MTFNFGRRNGYGETTMRFGPQFLFAHAECERKTTSAIRLSAK
jgi:hypothetical protein